MLYYWTYTVHKLPLELRQLKLRRKLRREDGWIPYYMLTKESWYWVLSLLSLRLKRDPSMPFIPKRFKSIDTRLPPGSTGMEVRGSQGSHSGSLNQVKRSEWPQIRNSPYFLHHVIVSYYCNVWGNLVLSGGNAVLKWLVLLVPIDGTYPSETMALEQYRDRMLVKI
jgi:hypothetical protein